MIHDDDDDDDNDDDGALIIAEAQLDTTLLVLDVTKFAQQRAVDLGGVVARRVGSSGEALQQYLHGEAMDRGVYRWLQLITTSRLRKLKGKGHRRTKV